VGVPELDVHLLMNHSIPGVNAGYITRNKLLRDLFESSGKRFREIYAARGTKQNEDQARANWPSRHAKMTDLGRHATSAVQQATIDRNPAANTSADHHIDEVTQAATSAIEPFTECRRNGKMPSETPPVIRDAFILQAPERGQSTGLSRKRADRR
jgi:hypothetical protein